MEKETVLEVLKIIAMLPVGEWMEQLKESVERTYGLIHRSASVEIHGKKGFLIWDYIIYNEITFKDNEGNIISLYKNFNDEDTEKQWNELVKKFGA